jgi:hypothetical protein
MRCRSTKRIVGDTSLVCTGSLQLIHPGVSDSGTHCATRFILDNSQTSLTSIGSSLTRIAATRICPACEARPFQNKKTTRLQEAVTDSPVEARDYLVITGTALTGTVVTPLHLIWIKRSFPGSPWRTTTLECSHRIESPTKRLV